MRRTQKVKRFFLDGINEIQLQATSVKQAGNKAPEMSQRAVYLCFRGNSTERLEQKDSRGTKKK